MHGDLVSYFSIHTGQASSFGGCMAQASYLDTARRLASFLAKKARFVTTSKVRSCHKAVGTRAGVHEVCRKLETLSSSRIVVVNVVPFRDPRQRPAGNLGPWGSASQRYPEPRTPTLPRYLLLVYRSRVCLKSARTVARGFASIR